MATVKAYLKNSRPGVEVSILLKFTESRKDRFEVRIGEKVKPQDWNGGEVKSKHPDHARINRKISAEKARLLDLRDKNKDIPFEDFKALAQGKQEKKSIVFHAWDRFMEQYRREKNPKTIAVYNSFKKVFEPFMGRNFNDFGYRFFDEFKASMSELSATTQHNYLACLQCFLNWCGKRKYPVDMDFKEWRIKPVYKKPRPLTIHELHSLYNTMMTGPADIGRRYLCAECFTGARISDIEAFDPKDLDGTTWTYNRRKGRSLKERTVTLDLVGFCAPAKELLTSGLPKISRPTLGHYIRMAGKAAGIDGWQTLTSHTGRKTAITLLLQHFTTDDVMDMVGIDAYATIKHYKGPPDRELRRKRLVEMEKELKAKPKRKAVRMKVV